MRVMAHTDPAEVSARLSAFTGTVAFDIGANCGQTVDRLHGHFNKIVACEPAVESWEVLKDRFHDDESVHLVHAAITNHVGNVALEERRTSIATGQLTTGSPGEHPWGKRSGIREVTATTLDQLSRSFGSPSLLKIDVEGHEQFVLEGGPDTLSCARPAVFLEIHRMELGAACRELLADAGYKEFEVIKHAAYGPGSWGESNHYWLVAT